MPVRTPADTTQAPVAPFARALLADVVALQTATPRRQAGRDLLKRITERLAHPAFDPANDAKACESLLYAVRTECLTRHGINDFPADPNKLPPLDESLFLYQKIDAYLSASTNDPKNDPTNQTENR